MNEGLQTAQDKRKSSNREPLVQSVDDTAADLNCSRPFVYKLIDKGQLKSVKLGGKRLIVRQSVRQLLGEAA